MSKIARQLCDEIQAYPLSGQETGNQRYRNTGKCEGKQRTIVVEKQRVISKVVPNDRSASRIKFKSQETILNKSFVDSAVNTTLRGPLASDCNGAKLIRNRVNDKCSCKTAQKSYSFKKNAKEVQTFDPKLFAFSDKACLHCVETVSCGTQFLNFAIKSQEQFSTSQGTTPRETRRIESRSQRDCLPQLGIIQKDSSKQSKINQSVLRQLELRKLNRTKLEQLAMGQTDSSQYEPVKSYNKLNRTKLELPAMGQTDSSQYEPVKSSNRMPSVRYMGARRWSLSRYPSRGPDF